MMPEDVLVLLDIVGLRPIFVSDLRCAGAIVPQHGLLLIREGLSEDELRNLTDRVFAAAAARIA